MLAKVLHREILGRHVAERVRNATVGILLSLSLFEKVGDHYHRTVRTVDIVYISKCFSCAVQIHVSSDHASACDLFQIMPVEGGLCHILCSLE